MSGIAWRGLLGPACWRAPLVANAALQMGIGHPRFRRRPRSRTRPSRAPRRGIDLASSPVSKVSLPAELHEISGLAVTADGRVFADADEDGTVDQLDPRSGRVTKRFALAATGDDPHLGKRSWTAAWRATSRTLPSSATVSSWSAAMGCLSSSPRGRTAARCRIGRIHRPGEGVRGGGFSTRPPSRCSCSARRCGKNPTGSSGGLCLVPRRPLARRQATPRGTVERTGAGDRRQGIQRLRPRRHAGWTVAADGSRTTTALRRGGLGRRAAPRRRDGQGNPPSAGGSRLLAGRHLAGGERRRKWQGCARSLFAQAAKSRTIGPAHCGERRRCGRSTIERTTAVG